MNARQEILSLLQTRRPGFSLPQPFYTDPAFFQIDLETIHYRQWLFVGHDCEVETAGDYFTLQIGAYPIVVVRDRDGTIRAFNNSCRHRGSRVCTAERGRAKRLVCPYHQWVYELDGSLRKARHMGDDFDTGPFGLKPVHCESVGGYIFICLAAEAPAWAPFRAEVEPYLAPHHLGDVKIAFQSTTVEQGNWKLVWENNRECYHCAANHPELCRTFPEAPTVTGVVGAMDDPVIRAHWDRCEAAGLPSSFLIAPNGQYRMARMPLVEGVESYTMHGGKAVQKPLAPSIVEPMIGSMLLFHYPSTWNHILGDHAVSFRVEPIGPTETIVTTKWLVSKDAVAGVDYDIDEMTHVWAMTNNQDRRIVEENQRGILSPAYEPGPYSPEHEGGVMQFVDWYVETMERTLIGEKKILRVA